MVPQAWGQTSSQVRPMTETKSCTENGCHAETAQYPVLHGPLNAGGCAGCHSYSNVPKHTFRMTRSGNDLCLFCHQIESGTHSHKPLDEEGCLECHNPHGGETQTHLQAKTTRALCEQCHEGVVKGRLEHEPISTGGCLACHAAHRSDYQKLLRQKPTTVCLDCHVVFADRMKQSSVVHEPIDKGCLECHNAHASNEPRLLKSTFRELCFSCHEDIQLEVETARTPHGALDEIGECANCHDPHAARRAYLLRNTARTLCLECHNRELQTPSGKIPDMTPRLSKEDRLHGPITINDCAECHQIHGGERPLLLVKEFPPSFYTPFEEDSYELCFSCHDPSLALVASTTQLTGFRDGDRNLHFVHVNQEKKGRTCRACHEIHSGGSEKLISESVYFGDWKKFAEYSGTATGGSCSPACHESYSYDRLNPERSQHPPPKPAAMPDATREEE